MKSGKKMRKGRQIEKEGKTDGKCKHKSDDTEKKEQTKRTKEEHKKKKCKQKNANEREKMVSERGKVEKEKDVVVVVVRKSVYLSFNLSVHLKSYYLSVLY